MSQKIDDLLSIMQQLRNPETGCPWDIEQNFDTIAPFTIEEAYEVADAIEHKDFDNLKEELGDLLLQVVFHAQMAREEHLFTFDDVVNAICTKLISRHPHVFGDVVAGQTAQDVEQIWEDQKAKEKQASQSSENLTMDDIPRQFPALMRAQKIQKKAIKQGFNWDNIEGVFEKLNEEITELKEAMQEADQDHIKEELGDVLFVCSILGRWLGVDAEDALQQSNNKFIRRFNGMEKLLLDQNLSLQDATLQQMDQAWDEVKLKEKS